MLHFNYISSLIYNAAMTAPTSARSPPPTFNPVAAFPLGAVVLDVELAVPVLVLLALLVLLLPVSLLDELPVVVVLEPVCVLVPLELAVKMLAAEEERDVTEDVAEEETVLGEEMANCPL